MSPHGVGLLSVLLIEPHRLDIDERNIRKPVAVLAACSVPLPAQLAACSPLRYIGLGGAGKNTTQITQFTQVVREALFGSLWPPSLLEEDALNMSVEEKTPPLPIGHPQTSDGAR